MSSKCDPITMVHKRKRKPQHKDGRDNCDNKRHTPYEDLIRENGSFEKYYKVDCLKFVKTTYYRCSIVKHVQLKSFL